MVCKFICASLVAVAAWQPQIGHCSSQTVAHVLNLGTRGNGAVFVSFDTTIDEAGCSQPYLELPANAPTAKATLALAALALATNATVKVITDSCYNSSPSFSGAASAYLQINRP